MRVTILGCGASSGVPVIGCGCAVCLSDNPKNKRTRVSIFVEFDDGFRLLVDTSPDLRQQALANGITTVDAIIYTHTHADHIHGIDDVRYFNINRDSEIDAYATLEEHAQLQARFPYVWEPRNGQFWSRATLTPHVITPGDEIRFTDKAFVKTFRQKHGKGETLGLRLADKAVYATDVSAFNEENPVELQNMKLFIVDCLREGEAYSHANLETALSWVEKFQPKHTVLTHMNHELEYESLRNKLPAGVEPGYDGLSILL